MKLYVKYDTKPPCLPVAVAESTLELAMMLGMKLNNVQSAISHGYSCWAVIQIDERRPTRIMTVACGTTMKMAEW